MDISAEILHISSDSEDGLPAFDRYNCGSNVKSAYQSSTSQFDRLPDAFAPDELPDLISPVAQMMKNGFSSVCSFDSPNNFTDWDTESGSCSSVLPSSTTSTSQSSDSQNGTAKARKRKNDNGEKEREKQRKKEEREREKEEKMKEKAKGKAVKQAQMAERKSQRPDECLKYVEVLIDKAVASMGVCDDITSHLNEKTISHSLVNQILPNSITFKREILSHSEEDDQVLSESSFHVESEVLLLVPAVELVKIVANQTQGTHFESGLTLAQYIRNLKQVLPPDSNNLTLLFYKLEKYLRGGKVAANRNFREQVRGQIAPQEPTRKVKNGMMDLPTVSREEIEMVLGELQLEAVFNYRTIETPTEVAELVACFAKAVALKPHKLEKQNLGFDWYATSDSMGGVKIDCDGRGLRKLWTQQLMQFNNVGVEVARAITAVYDSPLALMHAYDNCSAAEASRLLANIEVSRGVGVLRTTRRVGPELSKQIFTLFTSREGKQPLKVLK